VRSVASTNEHLEEEFELVRGALPTCDRSNPEFFEAMFRAAPDVDATAILSDLGRAPSLAGLFAVWASRAESRVRQYQGDSELATLTDRDASGADDSGAEESIRALRRVRRHPSHSTQTPRPWAPRDEHRGTRSERCSQQV